MPTRRKFRRNNRNKKITKKRQQGGNIQYGEGKRFQQTVWTKGLFYYRARKRR